MSDITEAAVPMTIGMAETYVVSTPMSDQRRAEAERQINEAKQEAVRAAQATVDEEVSQAQESFAPLSADLCSVRDDYATLIKAGELGQLTAKEFLNRMNAIRLQHRSHMRQVQRWEEATQRVVAIEGDPVAYTEHIYNVTPLVRPTFTF